LHARTVTEIETAFATMAQEKVGALVVVPDAFLISRRDQIVALAARYVVPTMYQFRDYALAGDSTARVVLAPFHHSDKGLVLFEKVKWPLLNLIDYRT
jgi:hypothetical protein